jgi:hypothetical protein
MGKPGPALLLKHARCCRAQLEIRLRVLSYASAMLRNCNNAALQKRIVQASAACLPPPSSRRPAHTASLPAPAGGGQGLPGCCAPLPGTPADERSHPPTRPPARPRASAPSCATQAVSDRLLDVEDRVRIGAIAACCAIAVDQPGCVGRAVDAVTGRLRDKKPAVRKEAASQVGARGERAAAAGGSLGARLRLGRAAGSARPRRSRVATCADGACVRACAPYPCPAAGEHGEGLVRQGPRGPARRAQEVQREP